MKIDTDIVSAKSSFVEEFAKSAFDFTSESGNVAAMLRTGVKLAQDGNRAEARHLLLRVAESEPQNETAWLWLASISEYPEELLIFLQNVLKINPHNERAIEWEKATKSLLAKTFVQRGIEACQENRADFGKQCFLHALGQDQESEMAWLWLASVTEAVEEKIIHLQKVLTLNTDNETAQSSLKSLKDQKIQSLLRKANSAAIAGEHETAHILLEDVMNESPEIEEAWILKAYLATNFFEKIKYYEQVLQINPANEAAQAGMSSLKLLMEKSENEADFFNQEKPADSEISEISPQYNLSEYQENTPAETISNEPDLENHVEIPVENPTAFTETHQNSDVPAENYTFESDTPAQSAAPTDFEEYSHYAQTQSDENPTAQDTTVSEDYLIDDTQTPNSENYLIDDTQSPNLNTFVAETSFAHETSFSSDENIFPNQHTFSETENMEQTSPESVFEETASTSPETELEILETISDEDDSLTDKEEIEFSLDSEDSETFAIEDENIPSLEEYSFSEDKTENEVSENPFSEVAVTAENSSEQETAPETENRFDYNFSENYESGNNFADLHATEENAEVLMQKETSANENYFADYNQPTVEFSYAETLPTAAETVSPEYFSENFQYPVQNPENTDSDAFENAPETENASVFAAQNAELVETELPNYADASDDEYVADFSAPQDETANFEEVSECSYCGFGNNSHTVVCGSCRTILSLSDLEMLLAYQDADNLLLEKAIERIESQKSERDLTASELQTLGIAHLNAKNLRKGLNALQEASKLTPNDVVLGSKVNFLAIRLSEIELQESKNQESFPVSRTIMVVDDSPTVRKLISSKLEKSGHLVVTAVDGVDAMSKIVETIPDLVLLDIAMPQMDGYQVCKMIRNNEATKNVPVVMISGKDGFFDKVRGKMVGSTGYITKPFGPETLMKAVETYIN